MTVFKIRVLRTGDWACNCHGEDLVKKNEWRVREIGEGGLTAQAEARNYIRMEISPENCPKQGNSLQCGSLIATQSLLKLIQMLLQLLLLLSCCCFCCCCCCWVIVHTTQTDIIAWWFWSLPNLLRKINHHYLFSQKYWSFQKRENWQK